MFDPLYSLNYLWGRIVFVVKKLFGQSSTNIDRINTNRKCIEWMYVNPPMTYIRKDVILKLFSPIIEI